MFYIFSVVDAIASIDLIANRRLSNLKIFKVDQGLWRIVVFSCSVVQVVVLRLFFQLEANCESKCNIR